MAWNKAVITDLGLNILARGILEGRIEITAAVGAESCSQEEELRSMISLVPPLHTLQLAGVKTENGTAVVNVRIQNSGLSSSYAIKQIGLFAKISGSDEEPVLSAIIQDDMGELIPTQDENPDFLMEFDIAIPVRNGESICVSLSSNTFATLEDMEKSKEQIRSISEDIENGKAKVQSIVNDMQSRIDAAKNAETAVKLRTARTINGVEFDGTKNISLSSIAAEWKTGTVDLNTLRAFNGIGVWHIDALSQTVYNAPLDNKEGRGTLISIDYAYGEWGDQYFFVYNKRLIYWRPYGGMQGNINFGEWKTVLNEV